MKYYIKSLFSIFAIICIASVEIITAQSGRVEFPEITVKGAGQDEILYEYIGTASPYERGRETMLMIKFKPNERLEVRIRGSKRKIPMVQIYDTPDEIFNLIKHLSQKDSYNSQRFRIKYAGKKNMSSPREPFRFISIEDISPIPEIPVIKDKSTEASKTNSKPIQISSIYELKTLITNMRLVKSKEEIDYIIKNSFGTPGKDQYSFEHNKKALDSMRNAISNKVQGIDFWNNDFINNYHGKDSGYFQSLQEGEEHIEYLYNNIAREPDDFFYSNRKFYLKTLEYAEVAGLECINILKNPKVFNKSYSVLVDYGIENPTAVISFEKCRRITENIYNQLQNDIESIDNKTYQQLIKIYSYANLLSGYKDSDSLIEKINSKITSEQQKYQSRFENEQNKRNQLINSALEKKESDDLKKMTPCEVVICYLGLFNFYCNDISMDNPYISSSLKQHLNISLATYKGKKSDKEKMLIDLRKNECLSIKGSAVEIHEVLPQFFAEDVEGDSAEVLCILDWTEYEGDKYSSSHSVYKLIKENGAWKINN